MQLHEAGEVIEISGDERTNVMLREGWTLIAVVPQFPRYDHSPTVTYVLGRKREPGMPKMMPAE